MTTKLLIWGTVAVALALSPVVEAQHLFHYLLAVTVAVFVLPAVARG